MNNPFGRAKLVRISAVSIGSLIQKQLPLPKLPVYFPAMTYGKYDDCPRFIIDGIDNTIITNSYSVLVRAAREFLAAFRAWIGFKFCNC